MNVEYEQTIDSLIDFNLYHLAHSPSLQRQILMTRVILAAITIILPIVILYMYFDEFIPLIYIPSILGGVLIFMISPTLHRRSVIGTLKKMLAEGSNQGVLGHHMISLSPEGLLCKTSAGEARLNWSSIDKVVQNKKYIFLYISSTNAYVIPKKAFSSELRQEFLAYVNAHKGR